MQTGYVLSAFAIGIFAYSLSLLISRAFYALHDTTTPVKISFLTIGVNVILGLVFVLGLRLPTWSLALSYSLAGIFQVIVLFGLLSKRVKGFANYSIKQTLTKVIAAASLSGSVMFILLRVLDRSAWDKKLSFLGKFGLALPTTFEHFVLDTRYTANLIVLTFVVATIGIAIYLLTTWFLGVKELGVLFTTLKKFSTLLTSNKNSLSSSGDTLTPPQS